NITSALSADDLGDTIGVADALAPNAEYALADVLVPSIWDGVTLAPTPITEALADAGTQVESQRFGREHRFTHVLRPVLSAYDVVLVDTTPALGLLLTNALVAAEQALIVSQPEQWSADGLNELHNTIDLVAAYHNPKLTAVGPLINGKRKSQHHDRVLTEDISPYYGDQAWTSPDEVIPLWAPISDYLLAGIGLDEAKETRLRHVASVYGRFVERMLTTGGRR
ncbi:ParA family protein, partial [Halosaccharopolyspora lacisalsi]